MSPSSGFWSCSQDVITQFYWVLVEKAFLVVCTPAVKLPFRPARSPRAGPRRPVPLPRRPQRPPPPRAPTPRAGGTLAWHSSSADPSLGLQPAAAETNLPRGCVPRGAARTVLFRAGKPKETQPLLWIYHFFKKVF